MANNNEQWTRVILLVPPAQHSRGLPQALQSQFAARDWFAIQVHDPHLALAELCLREKSQIGRAAWGLQRLERLGLVVLEPRHWQTAGVRLDDLTSTVKRFLPGVSVWHVSDGQLIARYQPALEVVAPRPASTPGPQRNGRETARPSAPPLDPVIVSDSAALEANGQSSHHHAPAARLRMVEREASAAAGAVQDESLSPARLTREEIDMLLDPLPSPQREVAS